MQKMVQGIFQMSKIWSAVMALFLLAPAIGFAGQTLLVGEGLDPSVPGHYQKIDAALAVASDGDVVRVESGMYGEGTDKPAIHIPSGVVLIGSGNETKLFGNVELMYKAALIGFYVSSVFVSVDNLSKIIKTTISGVVRPIGGAAYQVYIEECDILSGIMYNGLYSNTIVNSVIVNSVVRYQFHCGVNNYLLGNKIFLDSVPSSDDGNIFRNNLLVYAEGISFKLDNPTTIFEHNTIISSTIPYRGNLWKNNILYTTGNPGIDKNGNLIGDPGFVDVGNGDYHLTADAPAKDAGIGIDADGSAADIGMYGGVFADIWDPVADEAGKPSVSRIVVTPNPVVPGEPLRLRFTAQSNP